MALTAKEKQILRIIIAQGNMIIAQRMRDYNQKTDEEIIAEINDYKIKQSSLIQQQRARLDQIESEILDGGERATLPEG